MKPIKEAEMGEFLAANWVWILIMAVFLAMHLGGHGCGGHGRHHGGHRDDRERQRAGRDAEGS